MSAPVRVGKKYTALSSVTISLNVKTLHNTLRKILLSSLT